MHPPALVAKQVATLWVLSGGRVTLGVGIGVGVGGREHDYRALGLPFDHRHERLDASVAKIRALLGGGPPFSAGAPVWNAERLTQALDDAAAAGVDEFVLVPATVDLCCLEASIEVRATWLGRP